MNSTPPMSPPQGPAQGPPFHEAPPPPFGTPPQGAPPTGPPPYGPARRPRRRTAAFVAVVLAAGLIGGGAGAGTVAGLGALRSPATVSGLPAANDKADAPSGDVSGVADRVLPSVVSITAEGRTGAAGGSGIIVSSDGRILTNNHVVADAGQGGTLTVTFQDGRTAQARVIGTDASSDLAVIQAENVSGLTAATLGDSTSLDVGDPVVAIGSPLGLSGTVTSGIVSALDRPVRTTGAEGNGPGGAEQDSAVLDAIQTDAAVNPGNSGGPLVDMNGRVVGINSAIAGTGGSSSGQSGNIGLGFAIPISEAWPIAKQLIDDGTAQHALLGVQVSDVSQGTAGARLAGVTSGGPAAKAGLREGDVVTKLGDRRIDSADALVAATRSHDPGEKVGVTYERGGSSHTATVTLGSDG
ncbi:MAG: PDZ domain-containing protein [Streptosporangiales bacterium]|nr:PDZ domain-containing protein [Streptosporangiales bacterium]